MAQSDPENTSNENLDCRCRLCGKQFSAEEAIENALETHFEIESYISFKDGGEELVQTCPECGLATYLLTEEEVGCAWCRFALEECARCMTGLSPENVSADNSSLCAYCEHLMSKDD